jgi:ATP-dependent RNA helicase DHX8/PRP22
VRVPTRALPQALHVDDVLGFDYLSPPSTESLAAALEQLLALGALDSTGGLTDEGVLMAKLPLEPAHAKALLVASGKEGGPAMVSLIAMLSVEGSTFHTPGGASAAARAAADESRRRFLCPQGDALTLFNVLSAFGDRQGARARAWCEQHHVNRRTVESACLIRKQLREVSVRLGILSEESVASDMAAGAEAVRRATNGVPAIDVELSVVLRRCLTAAFFSNAAQRQPTGEYLALVSREAVSIHPSSVLFSRRVQCVLFNELVFTTKLYMRDLTQIDAEWLPELAPHFFAASTAPDAEPGGKLAAIARSRQTA